MSTDTNNKVRMASDAGIAIGPILFVVAILAILAAAIAAGSGGFTGGTGAESNKTKSSALIQIGESLKMGMDLITMQQGVSPDEVTVDVASTSGTKDLFSPVGGGVAPPSIGMANDPALDKWVFPKGPIAGFGTSGDEVIAVLPVSRGVCAEINNRSIGVAYIPEALALGNFVAATPVVSAGTTWPQASNDWVDVSGTAAPTEAVLTLRGVMTGCVHNSDVPDTTSAPAFPTSRYFYYQVLSIQ